MRGWSDPGERVQAGGMSTGHGPWIAQTRTRVWMSCAVACLLAMAAFALVVTQDRSPLDSFDHVGMRAEDWADGHTGLIKVLRVIEVAFATIGMVIWTTAIALGLLLRRRFRAAAFVVVVMAGTSLLTTAIKLSLGRARPQWQDSVDTLTSKSFPSGHASSSAALAGVVLVLVWGLLRRGDLRTFLTGLAVVMWLVVCLDRVMLGRHYPTDVLAGSFLGVAVVLIALVLFDPLRHRRPSPTDAEEVADSITTPHDADSKR
jgi:membrane-associated phospholipid phosphatase